MAAPAQTGIECADCDPAAVPGAASSPAADTTSAPTPSSGTTTVDAQPPTFDDGPRIVIEYCDRCKSQHRATWTQTELLSTFSSSSTTGTLAAVTIIPRSASDTAGRWRVWLYTQNGQREEDVKLVWDRKTEGGFGEMKELKQRVRDLIAPGKSLGHSDKPAKSS
ncbi:uncharacterized protein L969DRAFT_86289 [Mixia osmundae IAM 14324]|uniref:uncharacterized protein n=1 Tax=Mixia osmundae (strain CBS 9802 / IAM 14324 / JCM 22182 / KY 12970) TaxID=764103 RepID=UPI0004A555C6|nr:uncharacterized protein L969DRAFT_86289 [Mixia osmundae IAM 14324]KEI41036.1 hypothetical protein L969DRAFT_86289 [Mixia osmundae IAM 14324]